MNLSQHESDTVSLPISIRDVRKAYGEFNALDGVSLEIKRGEFVTLLGPSGSGKTTLLMVLAGFVRADAGEVLFGDRVITHVAPHQRNVGMVFQNYALFPHMSVAENVAYPLRLRKVAKKEIAKRSSEALELVQLEGLDKRRMHELSGGQRQRVALARAIVFEPQILLMDEPLSALDKKLREQMQIELRRLHQRLGITTVYVTHDQREALTMSDRIAVVDHGKIRQVGTPKEIYGSPASKFIAGFIGESFFLPITVKEGKPYYYESELRVTKRISTQKKDQFLAIRPEQLILLDIRQNETTSLNVFTGVVKEIVYQGESSLVCVRLTDGAELSARLTASSLSQPPCIGATIALGLTPEDSIIVAQE